MAPSCSSVTASLEEAIIASIRSSLSCTTPSIGDRLAGLHRAAGDEDGRDVEPQRGQQHARGDLVAVGDADQGVGAVRVDHVLHRVGDQLPAGQRVEHAAVAHRDAVVDRDRVELAADPAGLGDRVGDEPTHVLEVDVTRDELGEAVGDGDDRLAEVVVGHPGGPPQGAGAGHRPTVGGGPRPQLRHAPVWHRRPRRIRRRTRRPRSHERGTAHAPDRSRLGDGYRREPVARHSAPVHSHRLAWSSPDRHPGASPSARRCRHCWRGRGRRHAGRARARSAARRRRGAVALIAPSRWSGWRLARGGWTSAAGGSWLGDRWPRHRRSAASRCCSPACSAARRGRHRAGAAAAARAGRGRSSAAALWFVGWVLASPSRPGCSAPHPAARGWPSLPRSAAVAARRPG